MKWAQAQRLGINLPLQGHQAKQRHSAEHQVHHPSNIAAANPLNYLVKPREIAIPY